MSLILPFNCCRTTLDTMHPRPSGQRRRPSPISARAEHHFVNSSEIFKFLLKTNDGRNERPGWDILSATCVSAKTWECKGSISSHCLYGQVLCTWYGTLLCYVMLCYVCFIQIWRDIALYRYIVQLKPNYKLNNK